MPRPHTSSGEYPTVYECITIYGETQEQKCADDIRQTCEFEIQVWESKFLVSRVFLWIQ